MRPCGHSSHRDGCHLCGKYARDAQYRAHCDKRGRVDFGRLPPLAPPNAGPCVHLSGPTRKLVPCTEGCGKGIHLKVFTCGVHGECTVEKSGEGIAAKCRGCKDWQALPPPAPTHALPQTATGPEWVSTRKLLADAVALAGLLPTNASGIAGIPRSGMLPATIIATQLHLPLYELTEQGRLNRLGHGSRGRELGFAGDGPLVVVDDTVHSGAAMRQARSAAARLRLRAVFACVYYRPQPEPLVDFYARTLPSPHLLAWNFANNVWVGTQVAFDIDGVIVHDDASGGKPGTPYLVPRQVVAPLLCTGRREKHRAETEALLRRIGCRWDRLEMLPDDGPPDYAAHKARHYAASGLRWFIESDPDQAEAIHRLTGKAVICPVIERVWQ